MIVLGKWPKINSNQSKTDSQCSIEKNTKKSVQKHIYIFFFSICDRRIQNKSYANAIRL